MATSIGEIIEKEVRKQQIPIVKFADMINCQRNNVYDLFKRSKIDIIQLKQISKVLNRNFFQELANDPDLVHEAPECVTSNTKREIVSRFLEVVPKVMRKMGKASTIVFPQLGPEYDDCLGPDFGMLEYGLTFTIAETLKERVEGEKYIHIGSMTDEKGHLFECVQVSDDIRFVNIPIKEIYSEEEWMNILKSVFCTINQICLVKLKI